MAYADSDGCANRRASWTPSSTRGSRTLGPRSAVRPARALATPTKTSRPAYAPYAFFSAIWSHREGETAATLRRRVYIWRAFFLGWLLLLHLSALYLRGDNLAGLYFLPLSTLISRQCAMALKILETCNISVDRDALRRRALFPSAAKLVRPKWDCWRSKGCKRQRGGCSVECVMVVQSSEWWLFSRIGTSL